ncbi:TerD family protein [Oscillatoria salina]|uniref:TerD family protein n=1 Tax=Oscillatoria salina TaxID=331517 RepID=UPI0013B9AA47|nr:TerD family protein [Oscillatoria salina]MBZ8179926.1 TerD family protein [Oscillatoria salina IIICB1]NET91301.1 TerD family protein [Kamptonema sp. SIO1D9]
MTINLQKGQQISLKKEEPDLTQLMCGLGWDLVKQKRGGLFGAFSNTADFDLDASVLCLNAQGKVRDRSNVIYYGNLQHSSGAITHLGDNLTGEGEGDDEQVIVNLPLVPPEITKLVFTVNIYKCLEREQNFGQVNNAFVRLVNSITNREIARYNLSGQSYTDKTGMILAEVSRQNDDWQVTAIGEGIRVNSLQDLVYSYS